MLLILDNYDSFTYNLVQLFAGLGAAVHVYRNDALAIADLAALQPSAIVLSPGPGHPADAGISLDCVRHFRGVVPLLGVCLGHQCIAAAYGASVVRGYPLHGRTSEMHHDGEDLFAGIPSPCAVARYHSLIVEERTLPPSLHVSARSDGAVMAVVDRPAGMFGVQFHPESFLTPFGTKMARNFLEIVRAWSCLPTA